jgi:hypothetical protein
MSLPQHHQNARASSREELPLELRVYGLEGIAETQDTALAQQAVTLAEHDARIRAQEVLTPVLVTNQSAMQKSMDAVVSELVKTRWTLIAFALSGIGIAVGLK